jgi:hypothetical protein
LLNPFIVLIVFCNFDKTLTQLILFAIILENSYKAFCQAGTFDNTFGIEGRVITKIQNSESGAFAMAIQPDNKILTAGYSVYGSVLLRYNSNGSLDNTFDNDGIVFNNNDTTK